MLPAVPPKRIARVEDLPRADIFQVVFSIFRVGIFSSFSVFSLVSGAFTVTFRRVQRFVHKKKIHCKDVLFCRLRELGSL